MSSEGRVKVLIVGPSKVGKSNIANFLSGNRESPTTDYHETSPLRILEVVIEDLKVPGRRAMGRNRVTVDLWDVGGSSQHQACWPAIYKGASGIIFVMNPEVKNQERELELWYRNFAIPAEISNKHCLVFSHHSTPPDKAVGPRAVPAMPKTLEGIRAIETSLDFQSDNFKEAFEGMIGGIIAAQRDAEEDAAIQRQKAMMDGRPQIQVGQ